MSVYQWFRLFRSYGNGNWASLGKAFSVKRGKSTAVYSGGCSSWREVK